MILMNKKCSAVLLKRISIVTLCEENTSISLCKVLVILDEFNNFFGGGVAML